MTTPYQDRELAEPLIYPDNLFFWESASKGTLMLKRCKSCNDFHWFPRSICPLCGSDDTFWLPSEGKGKIYSLTITRKAGPVAYALAYVTLEEGVTLISNIVDCDLDTVHIGDKVQVVFKYSKSGQAVPMFRPVS
jgi:uncharacterized OB-fold protein